MDAFMDIVVDILKDILSWIYDLVHEHVIIPLLGFGYDWVVAPLITFFIVGFVILALWGTFIQVRIGWLKSKAERGNAKAQFKLGDLYYRGENGKVELDYKLAKEWWEKSAEQGHAGAQFGLGLLYYRGYGVPKNHIDSYAWFSIANSNQDEQAEFFLDALTEILSSEGIEKAQAKTTEMMEANPALIK